MLLFVVVVVAGMWRYAADAVAAVAEGVEDAGDGGRWR
jgi:hypothetical protein